MTKLFQILYFVFTFEINGSDSILCIYLWNQWFRFCILYLHVPLKSIVQILYFVITFEIDGSDSIFCIYLWNQWFRFYILYLPLKSMVLFLYLPLKLMVQILYFVFTFEINGSDSVFCIGVISFLIKAKTAAL